MKSYCLYWMLSSLFVASSRAFQTTAFSLRAAATTASLATTLPSAAASRRDSSTTTCNASTMTDTTTSTTTTSLLKDVSPSYAQLLEKWATITQLGRCKAVLSYDQLVFMPQQASAERGAQLSALAGLIHEKTTDPQLATLMKQALQDAKDNNSDDVDAMTLLKLEQKTFDENARIPTKLASKAASLSSSAYAAWVQAKDDDDFASFAPVLQDCFDTSIELARYKRGDDKAERSIYTQMLDEYEVGMSQERIDEIFGEIQTALVPLIQQVLGNSSSAPLQDALSGTFDIDKQKELCQEIVTAIGFDFNKGQIDVSVHPFTTSFSSKDVRITSRFRENEWYQGLAASIHECGHAIYEQNVGKQTPYSIDSALSMGTHESQSLFWERHVGLSREFWQWAAPLLQAKFPDQFVTTTPENLYGAVNAVSPSLIRVEADELTYPLHIIMRYNMEKAVIGGELAVEDIPQRWRDDMKSLLNVDVPDDDAKGCLQDVHWASLAFGYFPTYLIGSACAAQLAHYCAQDLPMQDMVKRGDFGEIKAWLTKKVHCHGRRHSSLDALLQDQLGERLNPKYLIDYLTHKYTDLYKL